MKIEFLVFLSSVLSFLFISCSSGGGAPSDNPPDVAGYWSCTSNCTSICDYGLGFSIAQSGSTVTAEFDGSGIESLDGSIDNDGNYTVSSTEQDCEGQVDGDTASVQCTFSDGTDCQTAIFTIES